MKKIRRRRKDGSRNFHRSECGGKWGLREKGYGRRVTKNGEHRNMFLEIEGEWTSGGVVWSLLG